MALRTVFAEVEAAAKQLCFAVCRTGGHLDFEAGCCSICQRPEDCLGWVPYISDARAKKGVSDD